MLGRMQSDFLDESTQSGGVGATISAAIAEQACPYPDP